MPRAIAGRSRSCAAHRQTWRRTSRRDRGQRIIRRMAFLSAQDEQAVKKEFERLSGPVKLTVFASELGPETNGQTIALVKEVAALDDRLSVSVLNPHIERDEAQAYGVDVTPAVIVEGAQDY